MRKAADQAKNTFTNAQRARAAELLELYLLEFETEGLVGQFNVGPLKLWRIMSYATQHKTEVEELARRVQAIDRFIKKLATFRGHPVTIPHPHLSGRPRPTVTYEVTNEDIATFREIHKALASYVAALRKRGNRSDDAIEAAITIAYTINPEAWREAGAPVSDSVIPLVILSTPHYLAAVMSTGKH